jgi:hypothetical protein
MVRKFVRYKGRIFPSRFLKRLAVSMESGSCSMEGKCINAIDATYSLFLVAWATPLCDARLESDVFEHTP